MTERQVTIKLNVLDQIGDRLLEIQKQRDALAGRPNINLQVNANGMDQARQAVLKTRQESAALVTDLSSLGGAIFSTAVPPLAQYGTLAGAAANASKAMGGALKGVYAEFQRQKTLAQFWGTSGAMSLAITGMKNSLGNFVSSGGSGFGTWLQNTSAHLAKYRTALAASAAVMIGFAAAAGLSSKHAQNYISATMDSRLMSRKLSDKAGAEAWVQSAQGTDWSAGRESRMGTFQTILSKSPYIGQKGAQKATEDIEKFFFSNQEMLKKKGIQSAEDLASRVSAPQLSGEDASVFEDIFGLGFSRMQPQARLGRVSNMAPDDKELQEAVSMRPEEILTKRLTATTQAMGDAVLPALNSVLGGFLKISDAIGKIPGLGKAMGWGAVLIGAATAGLVVVSMLGSLIPGLTLAVGLFGKMGFATKIAAAGQWILNAAMTANPLGIAIVAIAGLVAGLYLLEKKFGIVTKAWKAFSGSSIGKGILGYIDNAKKAIGDLFAGKGAGGIMKIGMDLLGNASPEFKLLTFMVDYLKKIWIGSGALKKLFETGLAMWQRMVDFFSWLLNSIKAGVQWVKDGLGITKSEAEAKRDDIAKKENVGWSDKNQQWEKADAAGWLLGIAATPSARLLQAQKEVEAAPGGIFEELGSILSGITGKIADTLNPVLTPLSTAITSLLDWLNEWVGAGDDDVNPVPTIQYDDLGNPLKFGPVQEDKPPINPFVNGYKPGDLGAATGIGGFPFMAEGGQIKATGSLIGHGGEEVNPAGVVIGGKTTLARINEIFAQGASPRGQQISITAPVSVQVSVGKVGSDMDIERLATRLGSEGADKLLFALRNRINTAGLRDIGYMRG